MRSGLTLFKRTPDMPALQRLQLSAAGFRESKRQSRLTGRAI